MNLLLVSQVDLERTEEGMIIFNLIGSLINLREKLTAGKRLKRSSCANLDDLFCNINELIQLVK